VRTEWASLCATLILASVDPAQYLTVFWTHVDEKWNWSAPVRSAVWIEFMQSWQTGKRDTWDGALGLISIPYW
jgi:hypothetical protein